MSGGEQPSVAKWTCINPQCGKELPGALAAMRFCPWCGAEQGWEIQPCVNCSVVLKSPREAVAHSKTCKPSHKEGSDVKPRDTTSTTTTPPSQEGGGSNTCIYTSTSEKGTHTAVKVFTSDPSNQDKLGGQHKADQQHSMERSLGPPETGATTALPTGGAGPTETGATSAGVPSSLPSSPISCSSHEEDKLETPVQETTPVEQNDEAHDNAALVTGKPDNEEEFQDAQSTLEDGAGNRIASHRTGTVSQPVVGSTKKVSPDKPGADTNKTLRQVPTNQKREEAKHREEEKKQNEKERTKVAQKLEREKDKREKEQQREEEWKKKEEERKIENQRKDEEKRRKEQKKGEERKKELQERASRKRSPNIAESWKA